MNPLIFEETNAIIFLMLIENISQVLEGRCKLAVGDKLLVGVSGGPDSLVLLDVLVRSGHSVLVAHYDHLLRDQAAAEREYVQRLAEGMGLTFVSEAGDTRKYADEHRLSIEEAARELRYQFLFRSAKETRAKAVVVGHHADDQVETVVMHLVRGAGLDGLSGMDYRVFSGWSQDIPLVRPLLGTWREEILQYCEDNNLKPCFDRSNLDVTFFRNRLRHELIPSLETYNPNFRALIWKMSETLTEDRVVLEGFVDGLVEGLFIEQSDSLVALDRRAFSGEKTGLQRRVLRRVIAYLRPGLKDIGFDAIEKMILLITAPPKSKQADLFSGLKLIIEDDRFIVSGWDATSSRDEWPQLLPGEEIHYRIPGVTELDNGWKFTAEIIDLNPEIFISLSENQNLYTAYLDLAACGDRLLVRSRQPGDRFKPLGMRGDSVKLSDFMINVKLPRRAREAWPLVFCGDELVWIPGYQISEVVRVSEKTKDIVRICLVRDNS